jgi:hypothetical protein
VTLAQYSSIAVEKNSLTSFTDNTDLVVEAALRGVALAYCL